MKQTAPASDARPHQRLSVWRDAMDLVEEVYRLTAAFPADERFGLTSQLRRSSVSVPSNIAEGAARSTSADYLRFLHVARGSLSELDTQLLVARRLGLSCADPDLDALVDRVFSKLNALIRTLKGTSVGEDSGFGYESRIPNPESRIPFRRLRAHTKCLRR